MYGGLNEHKQRRNRRGISLRKIIKEAALPGSLTTRGSGGWAWPVTEKELRENVISWLTSDLHVVGNAELIKQKLQEASNEKLREVILEFGKARDAAIKEWTSRGASVRNTPEELQELLKRANILRDVDSGYVSKELYKVRVTYALEKALSIKQKLPI